MYTEFNLFASLWNKYRPVILKLMVDSAKEPQQYKLSAHEFKAASVQRTGYSFVLATVNGKATNTLKSPIVAKDLFSTLQQSPKGAQLMSEADYELSLDKQFVFHVKRTEVAAASN